MPGYYDWKLINCPRGAITKAESLLETVEACEPYLQELWAKGEGSFSPRENLALAGIIADIDAAEDLLEKAKKDLAQTFLPGAPEVSISRADRKRAEEGGGGL